MAQLQGTTVNGSINATTLSGSGASLSNLPNASLSALGITNASIADNAIGRANMNYTGAVIQTQVIRYDGRPGWSMPTNYPGSIANVLRLDITPVYSNSLIIVEWFIAGEPNNHDAGVRVCRNGGIITGTWAGFNRDTGQNNHSFINAAWYDPDNNSTPKQVKILYYDFPGTTAALWYEPSFASTDGGTRTFLFNRTTGSGGQNNHENGTSFGRITEIRQ
jgi:hypothetical protein